MATITGCDKSTRVPQFISDDHYGKKLACNIVVAVVAEKNRSRQPRSEGQRWKRMATGVGYQVTKRA